MLPILFQSGRGLVAFPSSYSPCCPPGGSTSPTFGPDMMGGMDMNSLVMLMMMQNLQEGSKGSKMREMLPILFLTGGSGGNEMMTLLFMQQIMNKDNKRKK